MTLCLQSRVDPDEWGELLAGDPRASIFHAVDWNLRYVRFHPGSQALWWEWRDGRGALRGGLPFVQSRRRGLLAWTSGVGGTFGGPVVTPADADVESALVDAFLRQGGVRVVRRELVWEGAEPPAGPDRFQAIEAAVLPLEGGYEQFLQVRFPKKRRNECNRSDRRGLLIDSDGAPDKIDAFHRLYSEQAARWGVRPEPAEYLRAVLEEEQSARFFVAEQAGEVVGGHLCFVRSPGLFAWVGTTKRMPTTFPSSLLIREEARWAAEHDLPCVDLGSSVGLSGVAEYKRLLGAESRTRWLYFAEAWPLRRWGRRQRQIEAEPE